MPPYATQGVKLTTTAEARQGPDPARPYFRRRPMLPIPLEGDLELVRQHRAGLHPSFRFHNHSPGFEVLPNGDTLLVIYSSNWEYEPEVSLIAARLRFGAEQWDMPCPFMDTPGANDHAPLLWSEGNTLRLFWGNPQEEGRFPFQYLTSTDQGATWSAVNYPHITGPLGPNLERPQPINTMVRDKAGTLYLAVDAGGGGPLGSQSMLWATDDEGATWHDTLGRTFGRHTTFVLKQDGSILGLGGKNSGIEGFMPRAISRDGGRTYAMSKTPFSQLSSGQRPSVLRLASGRLFMAGDFYPSKNAKKAPSIKEDGSYVALSDDDGETWRIKRLPGTWSVQRKAPSVGYSVARQAPNGVIHVITSCNVPGLHYELNEAWILSDATFADDDPEMNRSHATAIAKVAAHRENQPDGSPRVTWSSGLADDGRCSCTGARPGFIPTGRRSARPTTNWASRPAGRPSGRPRAQRSGSGTTAPTARACGGPGGPTARCARSQPGRITGWCRTPTGSTRPVKNGRSSLHEVRCFPDSPHAWGWRNQLPAGAGAHRRKLGGVCRATAGPAGQVQRSEGSQGTANGVLPGGGADRSTGPAGLSAPGPEGEGRLCDRWRASDRGCQRAVTEIVPSMVAISTPGPFANDFLEAVQAALKQWRFSPARIEHVESVQTPQVTYDRVASTEKLEAHFDLSFTFTASGGVRQGK